jgi:WD40 repeat protein
MAQDTTPIALEGHADRVDAVAWLSSDRLVTGSSDKTIKVWNVAERKVEQTLDAHTEAVFAVVVHPEGKYIASGAKDRTVKLWDLSSPDPPKDVANHSKAVYSVAFSPDGKWLASCGEDDTRIRIWNVAEGKNHKELNAEDADDNNQRRSIFRAVFTPNSKRLVSCGADRSLRLWDVESGQEEKRFEAIDYLVYKEKDKKIERTARKGASDFALYCLALNPDGSLIAAGGADKTIRIWDRASGELRQTIGGLPDYVYGLAFMEHNRLVALGHTGRAYVWNTLDAKPIGSTKLPAFALQCALSPEGARLAVACADARTYVVEIPQIAP